MLQIIATGNVRVYVDEGVGQTCLPYVLRMFDGHRVSAIDATEIISGDWSKNTDVLCVPGGAAAPYAKKLNGDGNENIKAFVANGGAYFGICAGAYYGARRMEFDKGGPLEIVCENELRFFEISAIGPAFGKFEYGTCRHASAVANVINFPNVSECANIMFYGGPYFPHAINRHGVSVLASYEKTGQPSVIYGKYGRGTVVLSGVHPCIDETIFTTKTNPFFLKLSDVLSQTANVRRKLVATIFSIIGLRHPSKALLSAEILANHLQY
jgi:biotin--protein ligase